MTVTPRQREKLEALGFRSVQPSVAGGAGKVEVPLAFRSCCDDGSISWFPDSHNDEAAAWAQAMAMVRSPEGLKATMADKVRWLNDQRVRVMFQLSIYAPHEGPYWTNSETARAPEVAVDALFWKVP